MPARGPGRGVGPGHGPSSGPEHEPGPRPGLGPGARAQATAQGLARDRRGPETQPRRVWNALAVNIGAGRGPGGGAMLITFPFPGSWTHPTHKVDLKAMPASTPLSILDCLSEIARTSFSVYHIGPLMCACIATLGKFQDQIENGVFECDGGGNSAANDEEGEAGEEGGSQTSGSVLSD